MSEEFNILTPYTSLLVLESDADRERFKVKSRFRMRDGEKFFAQGRDNANYELKQQQMKRAGDWRLSLHRRVLQQFAGLGRDPRWLQGQEDRAPRLEKLKSLVRSREESFLGTIENGEIAGVAGEYYERAPGKDAPLGPEADEPPIGSPASKSEADPADSREDRDLADAQRADNYKDEPDEPERVLALNEDRKSIWGIDETASGARTPFMARAREDAEPMGEYAYFGGVPRPVAARQSQSLLALFPHLAAAPTGTSGKPSWPAPALELAQAGPDGQACQDAGRPRSPARHGRL